MEKYQSKNSSIILSTIGILAILFFAYVIATRPLLPLSETNTSIPPSVSEEKTIQGTFACLPHKNTSGPTTLECAFGLHSDDGLYYGIDMTLLPSMALSEFRTGERIEITGALVTPNTALTKYNITSVIQARTVRKI